MTPDGSLRHVSCHTATPPAAASLNGPRVALVGNRHDPDLQSLRLDPWNRAVCAGGPAHRYGAVVQYGVVALEQRRTALRFTCISMANGERGSSNSDNFLL